MVNSSASQVPAFCLLAVGKPPKRFAGEGLLSNYNK